jgi:hypothetical protein
MAVVLDGYVMKSLEKLVMIHTYVLNFVILGGTSPYSTKSLFNFLTPSYSTFFSSKKGNLPLYLVPSVDFHSFSNFLEENNVFQKQLSNETVRANFNDGIS